MFLFILQAVNELWKNKFSLADGIMESLDEESILKLIELALSSKEQDNMFGFRVQLWLFITCTTTSNDSVEYRFCVSSENAAALNHSCALLSLGMSL